MADNLPATRPKTARAEVLSRTDERVPRTEYVMVQDTSPAPRTWSARYMPKAKPPAKTPGMVPTFLGNREIITYAWIISMILVGFDEWHNNNILPRPARLWDTSIVYGLLAIVSVSDALVPLCNALAIGYTIMLLWQYYNGGGQFTK